MRSKEEYDQMREGFKQTIKHADWCYEKMMFYKKIYNATKGKSGFLGLIHNIAERKHQEYYKIAVTELFVQLGLCYNAMQELSDYVENFGE